MSVPTASSRESEPEDCEAKRLEPSLPKKHFSSSTLPEVLCEVTYTFNKAEIHVHQEMGKRVSFGGV